MYYWSKRIVILSLILEMVSSVENFGHSDYSPYLTTLSSSYNSIKRT